MATTNRTATIDPTIAPTFPEPESDSDDPVFGEEVVVIGKAVQAENTVNDEIRKPFYMKYKFSGRIGYWLKKKSFFCGQ